MTIGVGRSAGQAGSARPSAAPRLDAMSARTHTQEKTRGKRRRANASDNTSSRVPSVTCCRVSWCCTLLPQILASTRKSSTCPSTAPRVVTRVNNNKRSHDHVARDGGEIFRVHAPTLPNSVEQIRAAQPHGLSLFLRGAAGLSGHAADRRGPAGRAVRGGQLLLRPARKRAASRLRMR